VLVGAVIEAVRPERPGGHGAAWEACRAEHDRIEAWLEDDLKLTKIGQLLGRRGVVVPYRTLHRYATDELGFGGRGTTVPVADGEPGHELQVDFGRLGMMFDLQAGRRRALWALIFTANVSRHTFVWCCWQQRIEDVIAGCEAAWEFYGGVFRVLIPARHGRAIGTYAAALLDIPLPWTKIRQVYRLLNLVNKFGADPVEQACTRALECEVIEVGLIARIVARAAEDDPPPPDRNVVAAAARFARDPDELVATQANR
jgi:hypothetical protein